MAITQYNDAGTFRTTLSAQPTANRNIVLPDASGTLALVDSQSFTGTPTAPTAPAGTNNTQLATTAFAYGALLTGGNGYQKLPSGLIIQWGNYTPANANTVYTVNLPITFPNYIWLTSTNPNNNSTTVTTSQAFAKSTSQINIVGNASGIGIYWFAIGN